jgi:hypothetical protein
MKRWFAAGVVSAVLAAPGPARADDDEAARASADRMFQEGLQQFNAGHLEAAERAFSASLAVWPTAAALRNLAIVEARRGHCVSALTHVRQYAKAPQADASWLSGDAVGLSDGCLRRIAHIAVLASAATVVTVDGERAESGSHTFDVDPGEHHVMGRDGARTSEQTVTLVQGETIQLALSVAAPALQREGAKETAAGTTPGVPASAPSRGGREAAGDPERVRSLASPSERPSPPERARTWWTAPHVLGLGFGALAVAGLATGAIVNAIAHDQADEATGLRMGLAPGACAGSNGSPVCAELREKIDSANRNIPLATASFVVGGVTGAIGLGIFLFGDAGPTARTGAVTWRPWLGLGSGGVRGSF